MSLLVRASLVLVFLVVLGLLVRSTTTTVSIGIIGLTWDDNPSWWATRPVLNQTALACAECHEATNAAWETAAHTTVNCDACHGSTSAHIEQAREGRDAHLPFADARDLCVSCHAELSSRPAEFPQVDPATHASPAEGVTSSCVSCHNPHDPGFPPDIDHTLVERSDCLACHGPDEWEPLPPSHIDQTGEDCLKCHNPGEGS